MSKVNNMVKLKKLANDLNSITCKLSQLVSDLDWLVNTTTPEKKDEKGAFRKINVVSLYFGSLFWGSIENYIEDMELIIGRLM
jgi:hypothetical protein